MMARLAAIVLAAGASRRFGDANKLLAAINGKSIVRRATEAMLSIYPADIVVVTGHDASAVEAALDGLDIRFANNEDWAAGMGSSIAVGIAALAPNIDGAFIVPGDLPFLDVRLLQRLTEGFASRTPFPITYPTTSTGAQRNPVLWPQRFFGELASLQRSEGAKRILERCAHELVAVPAENEAAFADIDTIAELASASSKATP